ncbi:MAG: hypothetical protein IT209_08460 [Armatimonadetes bacterium]|nr:hypothetical protein [Armatimonadota bacterium]
MRVEDNQDAGRRPQEKSPLNQPSSADSKNILDTFRKRKTELWALSALLAVSLGIWALLQTESHINSTVPAAKIIPRDSIEVTPIRPPTVFPKKTRAPSVKSREKLYFEGKFLVVGSRKYNVGLKIKSSPPYKIGEYIYWAQLGGMGLGINRAQDSMSPFNICARLLSNNAGLKIIFAASASALPAVSEDDRVIALAFDNLKEGSNTILISKDGKHDVQRFEIEGAVTKMEIHRKGGNYALRVDYRDIRLSPQSMVLSIDGNDGENKTKVISDAAGMTSLTGVTGDWKPKSPQHQKARSAPGVLQLFHPSRFPNVKTCFGC